MSDTKHGYSEKTVERFWSKVDTSGGDDACWPWLGMKFRTGVGQASISGKKLFAHRIAWELTNGSLVGATGCSYRVQRTCKNPACCNPNHLYLLEVQQQTAVDVNDINPDLFWVKVNIGECDDCWEWTAMITRGGYGRFATKHHRMLLSHRAAWMLANNSTPQSGMCVCHKCDNRKCCNPAHLYIGSSQENSRDRDEKGRGVASKFEANGSSKLTKQDVQYIREHKEITNAEMGRLFGVTRQNIRFVRNGTTWGGV